ncbi:MAG: signal recognition particle-docking protein FtsY [Actinobacteria bacterium]|nr:signal recognition particle-docking protein FtsY [Actinomycetota bacterium]
MDPVVYLTAVMVLVVAAALWWRLRPRPSGPRTVSSPGGLGARVRAIWSDGAGAGTWAELEETLLAADVGIEATSRIVGMVRRSLPATPEAAREALVTALLAEFGQHDRTLSLVGHPAVVLVVGVNGSGKTTTVAKLAHLLQTQGRNVVLAAADTYRAAAGEQLAIWAERLGVPVIRGTEGADPASVAHDAVTAARSAGGDVVIVDTAGRLHSDRNLVAELAKVRRVSGAGEVLAVLDATSGQNGLTQVAVFAESVGVSGVVLAKLDGTARGGIVVAVEGRLGVPVKLVGVGEGLDDLVPFEPAAFVASLLRE